MDKIIIKGARENNLKNINIELPKNKLIVMTGVSGSGKSSLAFDTIFAEGQRRYVESLSAYARQFIGGTEKPDVDSIEGLSPSISIDQKSTNKNPRSTVGTITEIYDYLRLLFARIGVPYCPTHKIPIKSQSIEEMTNKIMEYDGKKISILSPIIHGEKGLHEEELEDAKKSGYTKLRVNGSFVNVDDDFSLEKNKKDNIDIVIDKLTVASDERSRIFEDIEASCKMANGKVVFLIDEEEIVMSEKYACNKCNYSIPELEPRLFSFNSPYGACDECKGIGTKLKISEDLIMPDKDKTLNHGALLPINNDNNLYFSALKQVCKKYDIDMDTPVKNISREKLDIIFYGTKEKLNFNLNAKDYIPKNVIVNGQDENGEDEVDEDDMIDEQMDMIMKDVIEDEMVDELADDSEDEDKWFPKYKDCPCCKGFVFKCSGVSCQSLGQCYCKMKDDCEDN